jgi:hypothetical protein
MSKSILLNTNTTSYLDLIGNGKVYRVPPYQRDYSWTEEQWEDLWHDIVEMRDDPAARHYMGALVVQAESDRRFLIIDGQQRMATLSLLALAVIAKLHALAEDGVEPDDNRRRAALLRTRFIGEKDPASLLEASKLELNETDRALYQDYLVQLRAPLNPRGLHRSGQRLWDCYRYFARELDALGETATCGEALAKLLSEAVARQLLFILITVDDELNAYAVFETLNARGLELTATDLLKNYLFSLVSLANDRESLARQWQKLLSRVRQERFSDFLRHHLLCAHPRVRQQRLFKLLRDQVRCAEDVFRLLNDLDGRAELYAALGDAGHGYWADLPDARPHVRALLTFGVRQATPLLFAAWEVFEPQQFVQVLAIVSAVAFRYTVVSGRNPSALEDAYHRAAKAVLDRTTPAPAEVFDLLRDIWVDDSRFEADFAALTVETSGRSKRLAKYILCRLESDAGGKEVDAETTSATVEHVLPENPTDEWAEAIPPRQWSDAVYRLGNLTLLELSANRRVGNGPYTAKVEAYADSAYAVSQQLAELAPEGWSLDLLEERQRLLAKRAVHLWRVPYGEPDAAQDRP